MKEQEKEKKNREKKGYWKISNQFIFRLVNVLNVYTFLVYYTHFSILSVHEPFMSKQMV